MQLQIPVFSVSFDLTSGYFQIPLKKEDIPKSAFCCKFGHYEMAKLPFGLNNAARYVPKDYGTGTSRSAMGHMFSLY